MAHTTFGKLTLCLFLLNSAYINANTKEQQSIETIEVTAQKRVQNAQDIPLTLSFINGEELKQLGAKTLNDVSLHTPGLHVSTSQTIDTDIALRGISSNDFGLSTDESIPIYLDGVYLGDGLNMLGELLDIERIEVLKGPQGSLFGRNAVGGAINIISRQPINDSRGELNVGLGNFNNRRVSGFLNAPLNDENLLLRISGNLLRQDGWQENQHQTSVSSTKGFEKHRTTMRGQLYWQINSKVNLQLTTDWYRDKGTTGRYNAIGGDLFNVLQNINALSPATSDIGGTRTNNGNEFFAFDTTNPLQPVPDFTGPSGEPVDHRINRTIAGSQVKIDWLLSDDLRLTSISAHRRQRSSTSEDNDGSEYLFVNVNGQVNNKEYSQEIRLNGKSDSLDWFVGLYAYHFDVTGGVEDNFGALLLGYPFTEAAYIEAETDSLALFADGIWPIDDNTALTLGGRLTYDRKTQRILNPQPFGLLFASPAQFLGANGLPDPSLASGERSWRDFSPRIALDHKLSQDIMVYGSVSQGYKSGGFNSFPTVNTDQTSALFGSVPFGSTAPFDKEKVTSYELGVKSLVLNKKIKLNASGFFYQFRDLQFLVTDGPVVKANNAAKASGKGLELDMDYQVDNSLSLYFRAQWLDATYDSDVFESNGDLLVSRGQELAYASDFSASAGLNHYFPLGSAGELRTHLNYSYTGDRNHSADLRDPIYRETGFGLINVRFTYLPVDAIWELGIWAKNLTNTNYVQTIGGLASDFGVVSALKGEPRTFGVALKLNF